MLLKGRKNAKWTMYDQNIQVSHVKKEYKEYREYKEYKTSVLLLQFIMKLIFGVNILLS